MKYATYRLDLEYFDSCLELDLVPEFLKFRPPNIAAYNNKDAFYTKAVKEQRRAVAEKLKEIKTCYRELVTRLISSSSDLDFCLLWTCVKQQVVNQIQSTLYVMPPLYNATLYIMPLLVVPNDFPLKIELIMPP